MSECKGPPEAHEVTGLRIRSVDGPGPVLAKRLRIECAGCGRLVLVTKLDLHAENGLLYATVNAEVHTPLDVLAQLKAVNVAPLCPHGFPGKHQVAGDSLLAANAQVVVKSNLCAKCHAHDDPAAPRER